MARPKRTATGTAPSKYKYTGHFEGGDWIPPHVECEEAGDHQVTPTLWPPPRTARDAADPHINVRCDLCGAHLAVYEGHATGQMGGVTVVLPNRVKQPA